MEKKQKSLIHQFLFNNRQSLNKAPWSVKDAFLMIISAGIILLGFSWGSLHIATKIFGPEKIAEFFILNAKGIIIFGVFMQVFVEMVLLFWFTKRKYNTSWKDFGLLPTPLKNTLELAIFLFVLVALGQNIFIIGMEMLGIPNMSEQGILTFLLEENMIPIWFLFIFAGVLAPITEELIFRGFILPPLLEKWGFKWGVVIAAFIFSVAHLQIQAGIILFLMGALLCVLYIRTQSLWPGIIFHSINNTLALALLISSHS